MQMTCGMWCRVQWVLSGLLACLMLGDVGGEVVGAEAGAEEVQGIGLCGLCVGRGERWWALQWAL